MKTKHGGDIWEAARRLKIAPSGITDFSASVNPLGMPTGAREAADKALSMASAYPDPGCRNLSEALSLRHDISSECICPGNGSTELIYLIPRVLRPGRALIIEPAFSEYARALSLAGAEISRLVLTEEDGFSLKPSLFAGAVREAVDLVFLANPANPTGALTPKDAVLEAAEIVGAGGGTLVVDEAFGDFIEGESIVREAARRPGLIVLRSMTKFFSMPGLRLGYLVARQDAIEALKCALPPWSINTVAEAAGVAALEDKEYITRTLSLIEAERVFLTERLSGIDGLTVYPSSANYLTVKLAEGLPEAPGLREMLLDRRILIRDLTDFTGLGPRFFRVSVRARADNLLLVEAIAGALARPMPAAEPSLKTAALPEAVT